MRQSSTLALSFALFMCLAKALQASPSTTGITNQERAETGLSSLERTFTGAKLKKEARFYPVELSRGSPYFNSSLGLRRMAGGKVKYLPCFPQDEQNHGSCISPDPKNPWSLKELFPLDIVQPESAPLSINQGAATPILLASNDNAAMTAAIGAAGAAVGAAVGAAAGAPALGAVVGAAAAGAARGYVSDLQKRAGYEMKYDQRNKPKK